MTTEHRVPGYEVLGVLGEGGMGTVTRARHAATGRLVAIKHLHGRLSGDPDELTRFRREAALCREIQHPGLVRLLDFHLDGEAPYLVFDLVEGEPLSDMIAQHGSLPPPRALDLIAQLAEALAVLHEAGIVHRDLKPANVIVRPGDQVCLLDFGVAKHFGDAVRTIDDLTRQGLVLGTLAYIPPDAFASKPSPTHDVWSLGVLLFELLVGERPFGGKEFDGIVAFLDRLRVGDLPRPSERGMAIPVAVDEIFARLTAFEPDQRPQDGKAAANELRRVQSALIDSETKPAPRRSPRVQSSGRLRGINTVPVKAPVVRPSDSRRWPVALVIASLLLVAAGVGAVRPTGHGSASTSSPSTPAKLLPVPPSPSALEALCTAINRAGPQLGQEWLRRFADQHRSIVKRAPQTVSIALRAHLEQLGVSEPLVNVSKSSAARNEDPDAKTLRGLAELELIEAFCQEKDIPLPWGMFSVSRLVPQRLPAANPADLDLRSGRSWIRAATKANRYFPGGSWTDAWTLPDPAPEERVLVWFALMRWRTGLVLDVTVNGAERRVLRWQPPARDPGPIVTSAVLYTNELEQQRHNLEFSVLSESDRTGYRSYLGFWIPRELVKPRTEVEIRLVDVPLSQRGMKDPELTTRIVSYVRAPTR